jgi:CBS-domain-containing membrane protein
VHNPIDRLKSLSVRDVMARDVVSISANQTLSEAAGVLHQRDVAWAPVVDEHGKCVGILSATDLIKKEGVCAEPLSMEEHALDGGNDRRAASISPDCSKYVSALMTTAVQSVRPEVSVLMAARMMCAEHIHRLPVLDHDDRPIGVVSTMDIVAALVNAVEESKF